MIDSTFYYAIKNCLTSGRIHYTPSNMYGIRFGRYWTGLVKLEFAYNTHNGHRSIKIFDGKYNVYQKVNKGTWSRFALAAAMTNAGRDRGER